MQSRPVFLFSKRTSHLPIHVVPLHLQPYPRSLYPRSLSRAIYLSHEGKERAFSISEAHNRSLLRTSWKISQELHPRIVRIRLVLAIRPDWNHVLTVPRTVSLRAERARFSRLAQYATIASSWREKHVSFSDAFPSVESPPPHFGTLNVSFSWTSSVGRSLTCRDACSYTRLLV